MLTQTVIVLAKYVKYLLSGPMIYAILSIAPIIILIAAGFFHLLSKRLGTWVLVAGVICPVFGGFNYSLIPFAHHLFTFIPHYGFIAVNIIVVAISFWSRPKKIKSNK